MDPMSGFDPAAPPRQGSGRVLIALVAVAVVVLLAGAGALILVSSGDDDGDDTTEEASATAEDEPEDDAVDDEEADDEGEGDVADSDDGDLDGDGIPDTEDDDLDGDGIPDVEDPDDDGDGVPDEEDADPTDPDVPEDGDDPDDDYPGGEDLPTLDLLRSDPGPAIDGWLRAAGANAKAVEVVLYTDYGIATIRQGNQVRRSLWRDGVVDEDDLEDPFPGTDLEAESFKLTRPNWDALPGLVADAPARAGLPQGEVTHVIVHSDLPFSNRKLFRIYVTAPNGSDYVVATLDGQPAER